MSSTIKSKSKRKNTAGVKTKSVSHKKKTPAKQKKKTKKGAVIKLNKRTIIILLLSLLALAAVIITVFAVHGSSKRPGTIHAPDKEIAWGIDVSSHNGDIDWSAVSENADFAFIRVGYRGYTEGEINTDKNYQDNLKNANKNGIPVGVYFYSQAVCEEEAEEEAKFILEKIKDYNISLPVVIDFEYAFKNGSHTGRLWDAQLDSKERTSLINAFCDKIRKAGYTPGIYASAYVYRSQLNMKNIDKDVFIWVADYNSEVTYSGYYDIWQYSEKGDCEGVSSANVDTNYWYIKNRL